MAQPRQGLNHAGAPKQNNYCRSLLWCPSASIPVLSGSGAFLLPHMKNKQKGPPVPFEEIDRLLDRATPLVVRQLAKKLKAAGRRKESKNE